MSEPNIAATGAVWQSTHGPQLPQDGAGGLRYARADREYRRAIRRHHFQEQQWKVLDVILYFSTGMARAKAWLPRQRMIGELWEMDEGDVSRTLKWLRTQRVIEPPEGEWYAMLPPAGWRVPAKVDSTEALEAWLERTDPAHPELFAPAPSLNDAYREVFVEGSYPDGALSRGLSGHRDSRVDGRVESRESSWNGSKSTQAAAGAWENPKAGRNEPGGRVGEFPSQAGPVGSFPSAAPREDRDREDRSGSRTDTSRERVLVLEKEQRGKEEPRRTPSAIEDRARVEQRLYELIGEHERLGECQRLWERAIEQMPEELEELIGQARLLRNERQITKSVGAWMNRSVYKALERRKQALGNPQR